MEPTSITIYYLTRDGEKVDGPMYATFALARRGARVLAESIMADLKKELPEWRDDLFVDSPDITLYDVNRGNVEHGQLLSRVVIRTLPMVVDYQNTVD